MKKLENDPDTKDKRVILDHHPHKGMAAHGTIRKATPFHMQQIVKPKKGGKF